jgi:hypothetical protein
MKNPRHRPISPGQVATLAREVPPNPERSGSFSFMVAGAGRGGTSLLAAVLDANPHLEVHLEFGTLILYEEGATRYGPARDRISAWRAACESEAAGSAARRWGNKVTTEQIAGLTQADGPCRIVL